jgi:hypothetical protein
MGTVFQVMAVGDSSMWGQGLNRADTYALQSAQRLAKLLRKELAFQNLARSGAKLEAKADKTKANVFRIRSGKVIPTFSGDRHTFADRFPELFKTDKDAEDFLDEEVNVQDPARALFGDVPATFPTITAQIRSVSDKDGKATALLLMNGGVNDVDFEDVLDPDGDPTDVIERTIRGAMFDKLKLALRRARRKFPNAVIIYVGYFAPFTGGSDRGRLERMFKWFSGLPGWTLLANDFLENPVGRWMPPSIIMNALLETAGDKVRESIDRSEFAQEKGLSFIKKAIAEIAAELGPNDPGIVLADPAFKPENALFGDVPMLHEGYHPPDMPDNPLVKFEHVKDAMLKERLRRFPRIGLAHRLQDLSNSLRELVTLAAVVGAQPSLAKQKHLLDEKLRKLQPRIRNLRNDLDGPQSLRQSVNAIANGPFNVDAVNPVITALDKETANLRIAQIASFLHPNEAGARRYADVIVRVYKAQKDIR